MSEENVARVRKGFEAHNRGDLDALVEFYGPEFSLCMEARIARTSGVESVHSVGNGKMDP
jgi:hypothetical protein